MRKFISLLLCLFALCSGTSAGAQESSQTTRFILTGEVVACNSLAQLTAQLNKVLSGLERLGLVKGCHWFDPPLMLFTDEQGPYLDKGYLVDKSDRDAIKMGDYTCLVSFFDSDMITGFVCLEILIKPSIDA